MELHTNQKSIAPSFTQTTQSTTNLHDSLSLIVPQLEARPISLLIRFLDDFFYVSSSHTQTTEFIYRMHNGVPEYGCIANSSKTCTSWSTPLSSKKCIVTEGEEIVMILILRALNIFIQMGPLLCPGANT